MKKNKKEINLECLTCIAKEQVDRYHSIEDMLGISLEDLITALTRGIFCKVYNPSTDTYKIRHFLCCLTHTFELQVNSKLTYSLKGYCKTWSIHRKDLTI